MGNIRIAFIGILICISTQVMSQKTTVVDTLGMFIENNPNAVCLNVVYEGTNVYLSADDENLLINLSVANPLLQMRLLMVPTSIYIDPTGKKKQKYKIELPSALDVVEQMEKMRPEKTDDIDERRQPDILPLLHVLNNKGATYSIKGKEQHLDCHRFHMEMDFSTGNMKYYILIPKAELMFEKRMKEMWSIGVVSDNDMKRMPPQEPDGMPPILEEKVDEKMQSFLQGDIRSWVKFSINSVNNINLK